MSSLVLRGATVLTMNDTLDVIEGPVVVRDGLITQVGGAEPPGVPTIDVSGCLLLPGFVQTHVHLCQTLFRGAADDLALLAWLRQRVWPMEAAHDEASLRVSTSLAVHELLRTGTTSVLTMETVHDTHAVLETLAASGLRATVGKCLMDRDDAAPARLKQPVSLAIDEALRLRAAFDGAAGGRIRVALAPRFAVSCTRELLEATAAVSDAHRMIVHTHASEQRDEIAVVRAIAGMGNLAYLADTGLATPRLCAAHCVWVDEQEQALLAERDVKVMHCPGSNLKLGSGLAPVTEMRARGITVSLGADGAACNNRLDMFDEMRLAATLQAVRLGPGALPARDVVWMATRAGAATLGLEEEIGQVAAGFRADLVAVDVSGPLVAPSADPYSTLVYASRGSDVRLTMVDGEVLVREGIHQRIDPQALAHDARIEASRLFARAGL
ncbi:5-methylthioadenosine/S-adenosylhomocysteine deaminase [Luteitalea sp. TBR-22]|uniref:5'-deoxyadenosine deaminase n=1 Tax=Luteitalea sp. TBR-22 TaxID=2802971 RepID=UPI001AF14693|nr:5'-deoxyadenosine deaminase [Luteitalea sp. TBR-22]BCS34079.1 5-methylthioadenosine/S-adenosylhomocysteine deaminase [Luteitalea sp. TBR-22]